MIRTNNDLAQELQRLSVPVEAEGAYLVDVAPLWERGYTTYSYRLSCSGVEARVIFAKHRALNKTLAAFACTDGAWIAPPGDILEYHLIGGGGTLGELLSHTSINWDPPNPEGHNFTLEPREAFVDIDAQDVATFPGGGIRESQDGRPMPSLLWPRDVPHDDQFLTLMAQEMADGARKYDERNWENFRDEEALEHTKNSVLRHVFAWAAGETDENHGVKAALNLMFYHTIQYKMENDSE